VARLSAGTGSKAFFAALSLFLALNPGSRSAAEPYIPSSDDQVLERLPAGNRDAAQRRMRAMREALRRNPQNLELSLELARNYIRQGKSQADPRLFSYAQGVLGPWWDLPDPPPEVLLLRASILQNRHEFEGALRDLEKLLRQRPTHNQAWLARASIFLVRAEYQEAQRSCIPLLELDNPLRAATCLAQIGALTGNAAKSYDLLRESLKSAPAASEEQRLWSLTVLATIAAQLGRTFEADRFFTKALEIQPEDAYLLGLYADFLLDENRPDDVVALLEDKTRIDSLLLRLALASHRLGAADLGRLVADLESRFTESRLRGENSHPGDEARLCLFLLDQPGRALDLARLNWEAQREPKDIRILLEAALAARDSVAARPALDLISRTGLEYPRIQSLAAKLRSLDESRAVRGAQMD
jgi:tetratricopeptide (TPR) repeat protein